MTTSHEQGDEPVKDEVEASEPAESERDRPCFRRPTAAEDSAELDALHRVAISALLGPAHRRRNDHSRRYASDCIKGLFVGWFDGWDAFRVQSLEELRRTDAPLSDAARAVLAEHWSILRAFQAMFLLLGEVSELRVPSREPSWRRYAGVLARSVACVVQLGPLIRYFCAPVNGEAASVAARHDSRPAAH